jgi:hypothetical protein
VGIDVALQVTMKNSFRLSQLRFVALAMTPLVMLACSSDGTDDDDDGSSASAAEACGDYFDALGNVGPRCLNGFDYASEFQAARRSGFIKECLYTVALPGVPSTALTQSLAACAKELATASCETILAGDLCSSLAVRGTREGGAPCEVSVQCASLSCSADDNACGICAKEVADGEACDDKATVCRDGSFCNVPDASTSSSGTCQPEGKVGAACENSGHCADSLVCNGGTCRVRPKLGEPCDGYCSGLAFCSDSVCTAWPKEGEPCAGTLEICEVGLDCNDASKRCEKRARPGVALGGACDNSQLRCNEGYCKRSSIQEAGVCTAYGKVGAACDEEQSVECESGLRCTNKKCVELTPLCKE